MSLLSLTDEKVEELQRQLREKKAEYERLQAMHIYEIWQNDLKKFLEALEDYEQKEEDDRLAHGSTNNGGANKKRGKARAKKVDPKKGAVETTAKGAKKEVAATKQQSMADFVKKQPQKEDSEMGLMERIKMRAQVQEPATNPAANFKTSVVSSLGPNERAAIASGNMKRKAPDSPVVPKAVGGNIQRKRAANGQAKKAKDDDDESDDYKEEGIIQRI